MTNFKTHKLPLSNKRNILTYFNWFEVEMSNYVQFTIYQLHLFIKKFISVTFNLICHFLCEFFSFWRKFRFVSSPSDITTDTPSSKFVFASNSTVFFYHPLLLIQADGESRVYWVINKSLLSIKNTHFTQFTLPPAKVVLSKHFFCFLKITNIFGRFGIFSFFVSKAMNEKNIFLFRSDPKPISIIRYLWNCNMERIQNSLALAEN